MRFTTYSKSAKEAATYRRGWSRIWGFLNGGIYLVPSETTKIVVQTSPDLKISCVFPPVTRHIKVSWDKETFVDVDVNTPSLLIQQVLRQLPYNCCVDCVDSDCEKCKGHPVICFCESCMQLKKRNLAGDPQSQYNLYEMFEKKAHVGFNLIPFRMGNVYPTGRICTGQQSPPTTLRQINFNFWNSSFNNDFPEVYGAAHHDAVKHHPSICRINKHKQNIPHIKGTAGFLPHPARKGCYRQIEHKCKCFLKRLYHGRCPCLQGDCACPCTCQCCTAQCNCACQCVCCNKQCLCCCCDKNEIFARRVQAYNSSSTCFSYPRIKDGVPNVCGTEFMASSENTDGVFISYDDRLVSKIPLAARSHTKKGMAAIGLALLTRHGEWRIDFKAGYSTTFTDREVHLV